MKCEKSVRNETPGAVEACDIVRGLMALRDHEFSKHHLTKVEREVANYLLDGETTTSIARKLFVSVPAAKYHIRNIYKKAGCASKEEFFRTIRHGIDAIAFKEELKEEALAQQGEDALLHP